MKTNRVRDNSPYPEKKLLQSLGISNNEHILLTPLRPANYNYFSKKVLTQIPNTILVIVGDKKEKGIAKWLNFKSKRRKYIRIGKKEYDRNIRHITSLHKVDLECLIKISELIILPGDDLHKPLNRVFLSQCFEYAKPIIACKSHKYRDTQINNCTAKFIPTDSTKTWIDIINFLIQNPLLAKERGLLAQHYIKHQKVLPQHLNYDPETLINRNSDQAIPLKPILFN